MNYSMFQDNYDFNSKKDSNATLVTDAHSLMKMFNTLRASQIISYDTETSGLAWMKHSSLCGMSFGAEVAGEIKSWYVPVRHIDGSQQLDINIIRPGIKAILEDPSKTILGFNLKFDDHMSRKENIYIGYNRYDTQVAAYLYNENESISLKHRTCIDLLNPEAHSFEYLLDSKIAILAQQNSMNQKEYKDKYGYSEIPIGLCGIYACLDAKYTFQLYNFYEKKHQISKTYARVFNTENRLTKVICDMEKYGIKINVDFLSDIEKKMIIKLKDIDKKIKTILGQKYFNVASDTDLVKFITNIMGLTLEKKTKKGNKLAVDVEVLNSIKDKDTSGLLNCILQFRLFDKLHSTFVLPILKFVDSDNILHGSFKQLGTVNGRLSSEKPNLQNISKKSFDLEGETSTLRKIFITRSKNKVLTLYDYSQIELRVMAYYSKDPILSDSFIKNEDVHTRTAKEVNVTRNQAKAINFGLNYGMAAKGLANKLRSDETTAETFLASFFKTYYGVANFKINFTNYVARQNGFFQNIFTRPRRISGINAHKPYERGRAERQAMSSLIAGTAADLTKESLVKISDFISTEKIDAHINNTIHDEIWVEGDVKDTALILTNVKKIMEDYPEFKPIPILVSCFYTTSSWEDKIEVKIN